MVILKKILKQLIAQQDTVPIALQNLYEESITRATTPDVPKILAHFMSCAQCRDAVFILLDAFDECDDDQQIDILALIREFLQLPTLSLLLTSRPHLQKIKIWPEPDMLPISAETNDVKRFLNSRLNRKRFLSQNLKDEIVKVISEGAEGM